MSKRKEALSLLREFLEGLKGTARVRLRSQGETWSGRWPWPGPGAARGLIWQQIKGAMEAMEEAGEVEARPDGSDKHSVARFGWPPMPGLFAVADGVVMGPIFPGDKAAADLQKSADEEESESQLPPLLQLAVESVRPAKASEDCARDILSLLYDVQERRTADDMVTAFSAAREVHAWSLSSVQATAAWLRRQGRLDNGRDRRGIGFGLAVWDTDPCPEE